MTSPSTKPVAKVLLSQIAFMADALNDCKSIGLGVIASIMETVSSSPGGEESYVVASTIPRSHPMKLIAIVWVMCAMNVWSVKKKLRRESVALYSWTVTPLSGRFWN